MIRGIDIEGYKNDKGFDLIAKDLGIKFPSRDESRK